MTRQTVYGQSSWRVASTTVEAQVTEAGGMIGPVRFHFEDRSVEPLSVAPWAEEAVEGPPIIQALRGDFFCMPFGDSGEAYLGEDHPLHGETANGQWVFDATNQNTIDLVLETRARPTKVYKTVRCGERAVYQRHVVLGLKGPMCYGHHAMVRFQTPGKISCAPYSWGQVFPGPFEDPEKGGYSSLLSGAGFHELESVPTANGELTDLTIFPARAGFEDLVQIAADPRQALGWTAVTFPEEGYAYFQLKDTRVLPSTVLWFSNGGRHYAPWSGRHRSVVGLEETCSYFHLGLRGSVAPNPLQRHGVRTFFDFDPSLPLEVKTTFGVVAIPTGFQRVAHIAVTGRGIVLIDDAGVRVERDLDVAFLGLP